MKESAVTQQQKSQQDDGHPPGVLLSGVQTPIMSIVAVVAAAAFNEWVYYQDKHVENPSSSRSSNMFKESANWLIVTAQLTSVVWFRVATIRKVECSTSSLSNLSLSVCLIGVIPFVRPLSGTGPSLTGLKLLDVDQLKINFQAILFSVMFFLLMTQLLSSGNSNKTTKKIHSIVGRFVVFAYVPLVLTELSINSGMVFMTSKVELLA
jgi:hypothetical protein